MEVLQWIQNWYASQCDGEWEHDNQVKIETLDNPGWNLEIDLGETALKDRYDIDWILFEKNDFDWYGYMIKNNCYKASGDPSKLKFLLEKFREIVEEAEGIKSEKKVHSV